MSATYLRGRKTPARRDTDAIRRKPKPPAHLTPFAVQEWNRVLPMLIKRGLICQADLGAVEGYCMARRRDGRQPGRHRPQQQVEIQRP